MMIFQHLWLKLLAVVLGILVWLHVATEQEYDYTVTVPVAGVEIAETLLVTSPLPDSIQLTVRGSGKLLLRQAWRDAGVEIRPGDLAPGIHRLTLAPGTVLLASSVNGPEITGIVNPVALPLRVDHLIGRELPIQVVTAGDADDGRALGEIESVNPSTAMLYGPAGSIDTLSGIATEPISLRGLRQRVTLTTALELPNPEVFNATPESTTVTFSIVEEEQRTFPGIPIVIFNQPNGQPVATDPAVVSVSLAGPPGELSNLTAASITASVDYRYADSLGQVALRLDYPSRFRLISLSADTATVYPPPHANSRD